MEPVCLFIETTAAAQMHDVQSKFKVQHLTYNSQVSEMSVKVKTMLLLIWIVLSATPLYVFLSLLLLL